MKPLNLIQAWDEQQRKRDTHHAILNMLIQQIETVEKIFENHQDKVISPASYNVCAGLIQQLKAHTYSTFNDGGAAAPINPDGEKITQIRIFYDY